LAGKNQGKIAMAIRKTRTKTLLWIAVGKRKKPRSFAERGSPVDRKPHYLLFLLDALSGLIFVFEDVETEVT
jgi:hypothetical protein